MQSFLSSCSLMHSPRRRVSIQASIMVTGGRCACVCVWVGGVLGWKVKNDDAEVRALGEAEEAAATTAFHPPHAARGIHTAQGASVWACVGTRGVVCVDGVHAMGRACSCIITEALEVRPAVREAPRPWVLSSLVLMGGRPEGVISTPLETPFLLLLRVCTRHRHPPQATGVGGWCLRRLFPPLHPPLLKSHRPHP